MKSFKKVGAIVMAVAMLASSMSAFACANDTFIGFDQIPVEVDGEARYGKLYMCPERDRVIQNGYATTAEWKHAFYEAEYPHREIEVLCLDGMDTGFTRFDGKYADVDTKLVPEFWEAKIPYFVYERLYSDLTGTYEPTTVLKTDYTTAPVTRDWVTKGFDRYVIEEDGSVVDYGYEYAAVSDKVDISWNVMWDLNEKYWNAVGKDTDGNGYVDVYTDEFLTGEANDAYDMFIDSINNVSWLELTGPDYATGGQMEFQPFQNIADVEIDVDNFAAEYKFVKQIDANGNEKIVKLEIPKEELSAQKELAQKKQLATWYDDVLVSDNLSTIQNPYVIDYEAKKNKEIFDFLNQEKPVRNELAMNYDDPFADVEWVTVGYEKAAPYRYYQVLSVNGVLMDGRAIEKAGEEYFRELVKTEVIGDEVEGVDVKVTREYLEDGEATSTSTDYVITPRDAESTMIVDKEVYYKDVDVTKIKNDEQRMIEQVALDAIIADGAEAETVIEYYDYVKKPGTTYLPFIWRYTGGYANPEIEWKTAFAEADWDETIVSEVSGQTFVNPYAYEIFERKFVDGEPTNEFRTTGEYAVSVPNISTLLAQPRVLTVKLTADIDAEKFEWSLRNAEYDFYKAEGSNIYRIMDNPLIQDNYLNAAGKDTLYAGHDNDKLHITDTDHDLMYRNNVLIDEDIKAYNYKAEYDMFIANVDNFINDAKVTKIVK